LYLRFPLNGEGPGSDDVYLIGVDGEGGRRADSRHDLMSPLEPGSEARLNPHYIEEVRQSLESENSDVMGVIDIGYRSELRKV
jgi:hypothetical protein